jgi:hypothetical protein
MPSGSGVTLPQPETSDVVRKWNEGINSSNISNNHYRNYHRQKEASTNNNDDDNDKMPQIIISTPSEFFNSLERRLKMKIREEWKIGYGQQQQPQEEQEQISIRKGEMYSGKLSEVFPDCTSSRMWIKQGAKVYENMLLMLERWDAILCTLYDCTSVFSDQLRNLNSTGVFLFLSNISMLPSMSLYSTYFSFSYLPGLLINSHCTASWTALPEEYMFSSLSVIGSGSIALNTRCLGHITMSVTCHPLRGLEYHCSIVSRIIAM